MLSFNQESIHARQQQHPAWLVFEEAMKTSYSMEDTSKEPRIRFEDWAEVSKRELKVLEVFIEFERRLGRLFVRDQMILAPKKLAMLLRSVRSRDHHDLRFLLEDVTTESGLTEEWDVVSSNIS